jgi:hypothetical protein
MTVYQHTCNRCHAVIEANGTVIEDSFDAAMNPYRVFISADKFELWCDDCIEQFAWFCRMCICDGSRPTHYYSLQYKARLIDQCPFCELPLVSHERSRQPIAAYAPPILDGADWYNDSPTQFTVPPLVLRSDVRLLFRTSPQK